MKGQGHEKKEEKKGWFVLREEPPMPHPSYRLLSCIKGSVTKIPHDQGRQQ